MRTIVTLCLALTPAAVSAQIITEFTFRGPVADGLRGVNEVPPNSSPATGEVAPANDIGIIYDSSNQTLTYHFGWGSHGDLIRNGVVGTNLTADFTKTGIYRFDGSPVVEYFPGSPGYQDAGSGTDGRTGFIDHSFTLDENAPDFTAWEAELLSGQWYVNVFSQDYPSGEIRGQLTPVPEPQTYAAITALGLLSFAAMRHYRRRLA